MKTECKSISSLLVLLLCANLPLRARQPDPARYPLRVHILAADTSFKTPRMSPGNAAACDAIDDILASAGPGSGGGVSLVGMGGDPCSLHPEMVTGRLLDVQDDDPVFSGTGRADLVTPPAGTQGFGFRYENCSRMRVRPGFQSLPARWKKVGSTLEVLVPSEEIPVGGRPLAPVRCTFTVTMHDFIYLLLRNGSLMQVSQDVYWKHPGLRVFLSGTAQTMERRTEYTVPAHPVQ